MRMIQWLNARSMKIQSFSTVPPLDVVLIMPVSNFIESRLRREAFLLESLMLIQPRACFSLFFNFNSFKSQLTGLKKL